MDPKASVLPTKPQRPTCNHLLLTSVAIEVCSVKGGSETVDGVLPLRSVSFGNLRTTTVICIFGTAAQSTLVPVTVTSVPPLLSNSNSNNSHSPHINTHTHTHTYIYIYVCVYVCVCVYKEFIAILSFSTNYVILMYLFNCMVV